MFLLSVPVSTDPFVVPYQSRGDTDIYRLNTDPLETYLPLTYTYERENEIFLMPKDFQGISELYTLGFYVDQDKIIVTALDANWYRILYKYYVIPEPSTLVFFMGAFFLRRRKRCTQKNAQCV